MTFLTRLFGVRPDPKDALRPLWRRTVELARDPRWYAECLVADTIEGRFDMVTAVTALMVLRMERDRDLARDTALLTELFVEDMDGQLREFGVGDVVVGKHVGKLMGAMGGRLAAYRAGLAGEDGALALAVARNVTFAEGGSPECVAVRLRALAGRLEATDDNALLAGEVAP